MEADKELLTGDVLLASAFISYVGPFTKQFRDKLMDGIFVPFLKNKFAEQLGIDLSAKDDEDVDEDDEDVPTSPRQKKAVIPLSMSADPVKILSNMADIALWRSNNLPADQVSTENGAIVTSSARWPLMIDPQLQGIKWIRQQESGADRNLQVRRLRLVRV